MQADNRRKLDNDPPVERQSNCRNRKKCQVNGEFLKKNVVHQAVVECDGQKKSYVGLASTEFKTRFNRQKCSFNNI